MNLSLRSVGDPLLNTALYRSDELRNIAAASAGIKAMDRIVNTQYRRPGHKLAHRRVPVPGKPQNPGAQLAQLLRIARKTALLKRVFTGKVGQIFHFIISYF